MHLQQEPESGPHEVDSKLMMTISGIHDGCLRMMLEQMSMTCRRARRTILCTLCLAWKLQASRKLKRPYTTDVTKNNLK